MNNQDWEFQALLELTGEVDNEEELRERFEELQRELQWLHIDDEEEEW